VNEPSVGKGIDRIDARLKVTGKATYAAEVAVANIAHAVIVGSANARGTLRSLDVKDAERARGVLAVLTHANAPRLATANKQNTPQDKILQLLQDDTIHYADQPIALVIADSLEAAQAAAGLVTASYTDGGAVAAELTTDPAGLYTPKHAGPSGEADTKRGDVAAGLAGAVVKIEASYTTPVENHHPMEMHATIAVWQGSDQLTVYDSTQGIFGVRQRLATIFGLDKEKVRVINHYVGGGFGAKGSPWSHVALAALGAKVLGRPVKLMVTRRQMTSLVGHRPRTIQRIALGADAAGKLTAVSHEVTSETSRFDEFVEPSAMQTRMLYSCPNLVTSHRLVRLDIPTPTFTRAPGEASGTYALESAMDELAYAAKLDPLELRIRNHAVADEQERKPFSSKSLLACYRAGAEKFGWAKRTPKPRSMHDGTALIGWGMATCTYPARQRPAAAIATIKADGSALVRAGTQDIGTGTYTIMTQIAADALGLSIDRVRFELGDTEFPEAPGSGGSTTASSAGSAVKLACLELRKRFAVLAVADPASPLHGVALDALGADDGALLAGGKQDRYADILARAGKSELSAELTTTISEDHKKYAMHSFGASFAEVRVDEELGVVRVARIVGAYAAGKILNAKTARSQFIGGIIWSIGMALFEETARDPRTARAMTRDFADYHIPVHADIPDLDVIMIDEHDPYVNELGAKGIGELGNTGTAAAIANAVFHATGKRIRDLPIRLDKVMT
jgi:xanthine dehydrogenase YagR molybdenum-binding subunit